MMADTPIPPDIAALTFEDALRELEQIVRDMESGQVKLDEAVRNYERGSLLKRHCEQRLADAKAKIEAISVGADGTVASQSFDAG
jgi:exodeoxyribonuclease VII small subunit